VTVELGRERSLTIPELEGVSEQNRQVVSNRNSRLGVVSNLSRATSGLKALPDPLGSTDRQTDRHGRRRRANPSLCPPAVTAPKALVLLLIFLIPTPESKSGAILSSLCCTLGCDELPAGSCCPLTAGATSNRSVCLPTRTVPLSLAF
jgi:hypothetical protein